MTGKLKNIFVNFGKFESIPELKTFLDNNEVNIVYLLETPLTISLTPAQMQTLLGENHVWADTGDVSVEYRADTKLYIDSKFSQLQALILEN